ncbi:MAG: hypothetical protein P1P80_02780 [ANME-2 cluster archaeon]|nr:hypothetical protein [ANME-2 cluster archaeon]
MNGNKPYRHKPESPKPEDIFNLKFIARNIVYPEAQPRSGKDVNLENIMDHLGGTKGEVNAVSRNRLIRMEKE